MKYRTQWKNIVKKWKKYRKKWKKYRKYYTSYMVYVIVLFLNYTDDKNI